MPNLSFQPRFAEAVAGGQKRQTIRQPRKHPIRPGDTLYLFTGMRTKSCRRLGTVRCTAVLPVVLGGGAAGDEIEVDGRQLTTTERAELAQRDGFPTATEMLAWFDARYTLPFEGILIRWEPLPAVVAAA